MRSTLHENWLSANASLDDRVATLAAKFRTAISGGASDSFKGLDS
jgi:hypothetical protein